MKKPILLLVLGHLILAGCATTQPTPVKEEPATQSNAPKPTQAKETVTAQLKIHVLADGSIGEVILDKSSGVEALDQRAVGMLKGAKAQPAHKDGLAVDSWVLQSFTFEKAAATPQPK